MITNLHGRGRWGFGLALVYVIALVVASTALAGSDGEAAREATKRGTAAYNLGQYDDAAREYERAYKLVPEPSLLFNIGQAYRQGGKPEQALTAYRSYLRTAPAPTNRKIVEQRIDELERVLADAKKAQGAPPVGTLPSPPPAPISVQIMSPPTAPQAEPEHPLYGRWWFWGIVGAVVVTGGAVAFMYGRRPEDPIKGDVDPGVVVIR